jgi:protein-S-isoprenylcysteine O-methyltransferase Ste14
MTRTFAGQFVATCYAIFFVYWVGAAFWAKRTIERSGWWGRWPTRSAAAIIVAALIVMRYRTGRMPAGIRLWSYTPAVGFVASVVTALGLMILIWGRTSLAGNWSADVVLKEDHELIEKGPYRYVRHPIYTGFILMAIGGVLLWGTVMASVIMCLLPVVLWQKLSQEERLLTKAFPDAYPRYKARVKALVPFVM